MVQSRSEILAHILGGKSNKWIAHEAHHGRDLIQEIRQPLHSPSTLFTLKHPLGIPRNVTSELTVYLGRLVRILKESGDFQSISKSAVHTILRFTALRAQWLTWS
jgi:hypothetical protein